MDSFNTPWLRFRCITTQQAMTWIAVSLVLGITTIEVIRFIALSGFSNLDPQSAAIFSPIRDFIENRFDARILAWIVGTFSYFWKLAGRELRKIDRLF